MVTVWMAFDIYLKHVTISILSREVGHLTATSVNTYMHTHKFSTPDLIAFLSSQH